MKLSLGQMLKKKEEKYCIDNKDTVFESIEHLVGDPF